MEAGLTADVQTAGACGWPTTGFVADEAYPDVTADNLWLQWFRYLLKGQVQLGHRVLCGATAPAPSTNMGTAVACANLAGVGVVEEDTPLTVCERVVEDAGEPWTG